METAIISAVSAHGPWVVLVFYLLWRDLQKDAATREALNKNTAILIEMTTMVRERLPRG
jgi:hypothetical protein